METLTAEQFVSERFPNAEIQKFGHLKYGVVAEGKLISLEFAPSPLEAWEAVEVEIKRNASAEKQKNHDSVNHPSHYTSDPSGVECIQITRHRNFNVGNAIKYLWRAGLKADSVLSEKEKEIEDLKKARWYLADEIKRLGGEV